MNERIQKMQENTVPAAGQTFQPFIELEGERKGPGMMRALRTLAPQLLITDEIGTQEELQQVVEARNCGVSVLASAHAASLAELLHRPGFAAAVRIGFDALLQLKDPGVGGGFVCHAVGEL